MMLKMNDIADTYSAQIKKLCYTQIDFNDNSQNTRPLLNI